MRFLLIDRILELEPGRHAVGVKNPSLGEDYFADHFPGFPVVPGVLLVEAMAQLAGRLIAYTVRAESGEVVLPVLLGVSQARFRRFVRPGDRVVIRAELVGLTDGGGRCKAEARVEEQLVAGAEVLLGFDTGQGAGVIPQAARQRLEQWADEMNRNLLGEELHARLTAPRTAAPGVAR
ncbi:MAG: 3-hydroxyacyl-ACP dehydratase FabZ family protein [Terriglobales bacterium]